MSPAASWSAPNSVPLARRAVSALARLLERRAVWREAWLVAGATALLLFLLVGLAPVNRLLQTINSWPVFHYVLGTKYFTELGYFDFYKGLILADAEADRLFLRSGLTRDLRTYYWTSAGLVLAEARRDNLRGRFSGARWAALKADLRAIQRLRRPKDWAGPLLDRGFNPSPAWLVPHYALLNVVDLQSPRVLALLCHLQLPLYVLAFAVAWWAFGARATLAGALWFVLFYGNRGLKTGGYFSYDWFFLTLCGVGLARRGHPLGAGALFGYAAMMRGFPALLALHPALASLARVLRGRLPERRHLLLLGSMLACGVVVLGLSSLTGRGPAAWLQWTEKIKIHADHHRFTANTVGLQHLFLHDYRTGQWFMTHQQRRERTQSNQLPYRVVSTALFALTLLAMLRRRDHDGLLLGLAAVFFVMTLSRYYFSLGVLLLTWSDLGRRRGSGFLSWLWLWGLLAAMWIQQVLPDPDPRLTYYTLNAGLALYFAVVVGRFLVADAAWLTRRLRPGRPETV